MSKKTITKAVMEKDVTKLYSKVKELPKPQRKGQTGIYFGIVDAIAKESKGAYKIDIKTLGKLKSVYPSIEKAIMKIAERNNVDFTKIETKKIHGKKGDRTYTTFPEYNKWKETNLRLRVVNEELFIEKLTDKPL